MTAIPEIHQAFCAATGQTLSLNLGCYCRERAWFEFLKAGFTKEDLLLVIHHLQRGIAKGERRPGCLKFSNLIERPESFEEELALAKAEMRNFKPTPTPKERAISQLRPTATETASPATAKPVAHWISQLREAAK